MCVYVLVAGGGGVEEGEEGRWEGGRHATRYNFGSTFSIAAICIPKYK